MKKCKRKLYYPEWGNYRATDANGEETVYASKPVKSGISGLPVWILVAGTIDDRHATVSLIFNYKKNWKKSLRKIKG